MYGSVNVSIKDLVTEKWGNETWEKIRIKAGVDDRFVKFDMYPDSITYQIVGAASEVLGVDGNVVLETFGVYWVVWCMRCGYDALFRALGATLSDFMANLDFLHSVYMKTLYPKMTVPSFRVEELENDEMILHYYSNRRGLGSIVYGCVKAVGRIIFNTEVEIELLSHDQAEYCGILKDHYKYHVCFVKFDLAPLGTDGIVTEEEWTSIVDGTSHLIGGGGSRPQSHDSMKRDLVRVGSAKRCPFSGMDIRMMENNITEGKVSMDKSLPEISEKRILPISHFKPKVPARILLDPETFCKTFPYHILFNGDLMIMHSGSKLQQFCPLINDEGARLRDILILDHPQIELTSENIFLFLNMIFMATLKKEAMAPHMPVVSLRGQMVWMPESNLFVFLCSPQLTSLNDLRDRKMHFSDIASHDLTRDLILFNQQRIAEVELAKQLEQKKEELRILMRDLELEKKKTDTLLYSMLPKEVANDLRDGKKVEAGDFQQVTISFSDIVKFTDMCAQCDPIQIVHLLNEMYVVFDELTSVHNVYKVETIGDAYMTVGGLPIPNDTHAEQVTSFGLGQIEGVKSISSPVTGEKIQIRVGIHTGPVVAGVVGVKMPRYCLFGDTVNTASRMESHGVPGKVHISPSTYRAIKGKGFETEARGGTEIKGKGRMMTHFVTSRTNQANDDSSASEEEADDQSSSDDNGIHVPVIINEPIPTTNIEEKITTADVTTPSGVKNEPSKTQSSSSYGDNGRNTSSTLCIVL
ncbi:guanylate cyclase soluble subunit beta-2-like [Lytechinus variegatus]|uniref:guanylate cyclase soluble subunit beta-2-like n=1 Tax=Lytechinus variegatus TaxID=7654 RepID=UPI001BB12A74|nr:guanylate cyclase soluble subunit beta-2-like [Lytechinus variegatus]